ncbi:tetratricopeptide repeat protein [Arsenicibacter rosenii]|uniref:tetratricopeptide repeat protein n=1 Tax=Arsenicibacter rosenii TaxID=1750698 RepID=UPI0009F307AD|nr:tetratricopeptide repeat protein [Arsenicibacter rosenii]
MAQRKPSKTSVQPEKRAQPASVKTPLPVTLPEKTAGFGYVLMGVLAVAVLAAFSFGFKNDFVDWDDMEYVVENPLFLYPGVYGWGSLWKTVVALNYHPLTVISLALNYKLFGSAATSFIITNVLIHIANTLLIYRFGQRLLQTGPLPKLAETPWVAFFTALIWGIHPMHVESVIWVSERKDVLYTLFFLLACLTYLRYRRENVRTWLWVTLGLFTLACLSKAMAVVLPLVLILIDYWQEGSHSRKAFSPAALAEKIPFFGLSLLFGWIAVDVQKGGDFYGMLQILEQKSAVSALPFSWRWLVYGSYGFVMYLVRLVLPVGLSAFYPYPDRVALVPVEGVYWIGPVVFAAALGLLVWGLLTQKRLLVFSLGFFLVTIILVLQFMTVGTAMMADRYSYLPYFGLLFGGIAFLANALLANPSGQTPFRLIAGAFAVACFYLTTRQVAVWQNTETLWTHALTEYPACDQIHEGLGDYYGKRNEIDKAIEHFSAALADGTERFHVYEGLGNAYGLKGELDKAIPMFDKAISMNGSRSDLFYNRGITIMRARPEEAVLNFDKAMQLDPANDTLIRPNRAYALLLAKRYPESIAEYNTVLQAKPADATAWHNRGVCRFNTGDRVGAIADIRKAIALKPDYAEARSNLQAINP